MESKEPTTYFNQEMLIEHFQTNAPRKVSNVRGEDGGFDIGIKKINFTSFGFSGKFQSFDFNGCKFTDCNFRDIWGFFLYFHDCEFINCRFENSRFSHGQFSWSNLQFQKCYFRNVEIDEGDLDNAWFDNCALMGVTFLGETMFNVNFTESNLENTQFQSVTYYADEDILEDEEAPDLFFSTCTIAFSQFITSDLRNSLFVGCTLHQSAFTDCRLRDQCFDIADKPKYRHLVSIDFQTILKSDLNDPVILKEVFNIRVPDIKKRIAEISSEITYKKVFISYSLKDSYFATPLRNILEKHGVECFMWEKDAPGGAYLEDIMSNNVRSHETLLFIASQHSLKSKACQFELSEGNKMQEETWNNIFFPIHIDNYLFEIKENQIRPIEKQKEYWANIQELKRTNSKNFTNFSSPEKINLNLLEKEILNHIIRYLKA